MHANRSTTRWLIGAAALLASGIAIGSEAPSKWKVAQQTVKIQAPLDKVAGSIVANPGAPSAAAVVDGPPVTPAAFRRIAQSAELDVHSIATVKQKIAQAVGPGAGTAVILPGAVSLPVSGGGTVEIRHVVLPGDRLVYDPASDEFVGSIRVGAVAYGGQAPATLTDPVTFQVLDGGTNAASTIVVKAVAPPFEPITVRVRNPRPPVTLRVASGSNQPSSDVVVPLEPTLFIQPANRTIRGDGLGSTDIQVQAIADAIAPNQAVLLSAEPSAELTPSRVVLGPDGTGVAKLTSVGIGTVTITARAAGFEEASTSVVFGSVARTLSVTPTSSTIQGFGLGVTVLSIDASAPDLPADLPVRVNVNPAGNLENKEYRLKQGHLDLPLQSEGVGDVTITVSAAGYEPATTTVSFEPPLQTLGAGLGGGLLGGTGRVLARPSARRKWTTVIASLGLSVVVAIIAYVLFRIGVNVFPITPTVTTGAVVVFALAALAGFMGATLLQGGALATGGKPT